MGRCQNRTERERERKLKSQLKREKEGSQNGNANIQWEEAMDGKCGGDTHSCMQGSERERELICET